MRRTLAHAVFVTLLSGLATVVGVVTSMTLTNAGRDLVARLASLEVDGIIRGDLTIGRVAGSFIRSLRLEEVVVRDSSGDLVATVPSIRLTYRLPQLLAGQIVLTGIQLDRPVVHLRKKDTGRLNIEDVLRLGEGSGGRSPLVEFRNVAIAGGTITIDLPWSPPDTAQSGPPLASVLAAERAKAGRRIVPDSAGGFRRIITIDSLTTRLPLVVVSTPDHQPLTVDLDGLAARISDPQVTLRDAAGRIQVPGDSLVFSLDRVAFPNTEAVGGGVVRWSDGEEFYDFTFTSSRAALADFRWVSPNLPTLSGRATLAARTETSDRTAFVLQELHLTGAGGTRVDGEMTVVTDDRRGTGFRDLRLETTRLDLDAIRPFLDTIPFYGTITGTTALNGYVDGFAGTADWEFRDTSNDSIPITLLRAEGRFHSDPVEGLVFDSVAVGHADVDLRTVRRLAPAVVLEGRLEADGLLQGPLRNATFTGALSHRDGPRPVSAVHGRMRLDTRADDVAMDIDVTVDSLWFDGIRRGLPRVPVRGRVEGSVRMAGTLRAMDVDVDLRGDLGALRLAGRAALVPERFGGDGMEAEFTDLDLAALLGTGPRTRLNGYATLDGFRGSGTAGLGSIHARLGESRLREFVIDSGAADISLRDSIITVDTLRVAWPRGSLTGGGTVGEALPYRGRMALALRVDSLGVFDTLVVNALGVTRDTVDWEPLSGSLEATVDVRGALDALSATGTLTAVDIALGRVAVPHARGSVAWASGDRSSISLTATMDTLQYGTLDYPVVQVQLQGRPDSLLWSGGAVLGGTTRIDLAGRRVVSDSVERWFFDRLDAALVDKRWQLMTPTELAIRDTSVTISLVNVAATDGSGFIRLTPHDGGRTLTLEALGVGIQDLYGLLQRDTTEVSGSLAANLELGGTRESPTITGTIQMADATLQDFRGPLGRGIVHYQDRILEANLLLWRTGQTVLRVEASLPIDLGLRPVEDRRLPGPLLVRAVADSVDLGVLDAFSRSVQQVRGNMYADLQIEGTWEDPRLTGTLSLVNARARVPGLGVAFRDIRGRAHMVGDTVVIDTLRIEGETGGSADIGGWVRMENLTEPVLNLNASASNFLVIDVRDYLTLAVSGNVRLTGPFWTPVLTGGITANRGVLYFADLVNKQVVDLEDPANADLVDLEVIRERRLGADLQNRFLDSLRIVNLDLGVRDNFWLRSSEANIGLDGQLRVNKVRQEYRLDGELRALRGNYALRLGNLVTRNFTVLRGDVKYFGTPDLDAQIDIEAEHRVTPVDRGEQIPIIAHITGTLQAPQLELRNTNGPPIPESDLVSYLVLGRPGSGFGGVGPGGQESGALAFGTSALFSTLTSEVERALISDVGLPIDYVAIRPGSGSLLGSSTTATRIAAGWRLTRAVFITLSAGFCPNDQLLNYKALGASLEWRFGLRWRSSISVEPVGNCGISNQPDVLQSTRYQIGVDLLWEKEY